MQDIVFANAEVVGPDRVFRGGVVVKDGRIADIFEGQASVAAAIDCGGDFLCPGLIELHTDNLERHLEPRPGATWPRPPAIVAHDAELAGVGVSTVFDALRVGSIPSHQKAGYRVYARGVCSEIEAMRAAGALRIDHRIHLRAEICSETLLEELASFSARDAIGLVSLMDHSPGQRQFADPEQHRTYLAGKKRMSDEEVEAHFALLRRLIAANGEAHKQAAVAFAEAVGARLASHDDTLPEHVAESKALGVSLAEFPTTRAAAEACAEAGVAVMMGAPNLLRGGSHSGNVAAHELLETGRLDILSSDYAPSALLTGAVRAGEMLGDIGRGLAMATGNPARAAGLDDRGRVEVGLRADLLRFSVINGAPVTRGLWVEGKRVA